MFLSGVLWCGRLRKLFILYVLFPQIHNSSRSCYQGVKQGKVWLERHCHMSDKYASKVPRWWGEWSGKCHGAEETKGT